MMEIKGENMDEVMLPGFRFHPTDEELVGFYLKRKIQQQPLSMELIRQLDIYKYDPWDLPKLASAGEKEWYFYCPRDRKYRNSARPNRVTGAGFWKATGTDRPIYSSEGTKCIGLKKSLVFYRGRAAKGVKTEWMMHEFRLPSLLDPSSPTRFAHKTTPAHDSWAICRIFKKTNSTNHQRTDFSHHNHHHHHHHQSDLPLASPDQNISSSELPNISATTLTPQPMIIPSRQNTVPLTDIPTDIMQIESSPLADMFPSLHFATPNKTISSMLTSDHIINNGPEEKLFSPFQTSEVTNKCLAVDISPIILNMSWSDQGDVGRVFEGLDSYIGYQDHRQHVGDDDLFCSQQIHLQSSGGLILGLQDEEHQWNRSVGLSYGLTHQNGDDAWRSNSVLWDPGELSTLFSTTTTTTTNCYT